LLSSRVYLIVMTLLRIAKPSSTNTGVMPFLKNSMHLTRTTLGLLPLFPLVKNRLPVNGFLKPN
jgi:hypothetical protein